MKKILLLLLLFSCTVNVIAAPKFFENDGKNVKPDPIYNKLITVPKGVVLSVKLQQPADINALSVADNMNVVLKDDFYYNGKIIFNEGSIIKGTIIKNNKLEEEGKTQLTLKFTSITTQNEENIPISAIVKTEDKSGILTVEKGSSLSDEDMYIILMQPVTYIKK